MQPITARKRPSATAIYAVLLLVLIASMALALSSGAVHLSLRQITGYIGHSLGFSSVEVSDQVHQALFLQIRMPRVLLCTVVGASLAVSGALMQALFRNPIVEPGLAGTSAGAALGAAAVFVLGHSLPLALHPYLSSVVLPLAAFAGGLTATLIVYRLASTGGRTPLATLILIGVAVNAMAIGGTGFFSYIARDPQARSITFWNLGTFAAADWPTFWLVLCTTLVCILLALFQAKGLNALLLGEAEAQSLGVDTDRLKTRVLLINTCMVAVATSVVGVISFVGLVVPHILRLAGGADNRYLIIGSALLGAGVMVLADVAARLIIAPAELPVGILTAFVGAPVFIITLVRQSRKAAGGGFYA